MPEEKPKTDVVATQPKKEIRPVQDESLFSNYLDTNRFEHVYRIAQIFASSTIIPEHYRGQTGNCFVATQMAIRLGVDPLMFMQKSYVVKGKPGIEAQLAIALVNTSGIFKDALDYEVDGDNPKDKKYRVRCFATRITTGKQVFGPWVDWPLVEGEGWDKKEGSKWKTMPGLMFMYRAAAFFSRMHCPERLMGMSTNDELQDIEESRPFSNGNPVVKVVSAKTVSDPTKPVEDPLMAGVGEPAWVHVDHKMPADAEKTMSEIEANQTVRTNKQLVHDEIFAEVSHRIERLKAGDKEEPRLIVGELNVARDVLGEEEYSHLMNKLAERMRELAIQ